MRSSQQKNVLQQFFGIHITTYNFPLNREEYFCFKIESIIMTNVLEHLRFFRFPCKHAWLWAWPVWL